MILDGYVFLGRYDILTGVFLTSRQYNHTGIQIQTMTKYSRPAVNALKSPVVNALKLIGGKWKIAIIYNLRGEPVRFGELKRTLSPITQQMLTKQLRELERDLLIDRKVFEVIPPKVEYSLTEFGQSFMPVMESLCKWSTENQTLMQGISEREEPAPAIALDHATS